MTASHSFALAEASAVVQYAGCVHHFDDLSSFPRADDGFDQPTHIDLRDPEGFARLARVDPLWPLLPAEQRRAWLKDLDLVPPPRALAAAEIAILPGGALTLREPGLILVCDPADAMVFNEAEAKRLRRAFASRQDVSTVSHGPAGLVIQPGVPKILPPQAVTVVPETVKPPFRMGRAGPMLIQWNPRGAAAWPLVEAPARIALAASIAALPLPDRSAGPFARGYAIAAAKWRAATAEDRAERIAPPLTEYLNELLEHAVSGGLLRALTDACVEGPDCLARRVAESLAALPSCFLPDPAAIPGAPPAAWGHAMRHLESAAPDQALLGLDDLLTPFNTIRALREAIDDADIAAFAETGEPLSERAVKLHSDAAIFLARKAGARGRLGVFIPVPATQVDLYALAHEIAAATEARVVVAAPGWGFCHRVSPDGQEAGNAGWFGLGLSLDETDLLVADVLQA